MKEQNIKIFISCHKKCELLRNKYIFPIQVGTALSPERFPDMFHDDDGENISKLNPMYCELTAQYWAWKNIDADYYGFMHYRLYFSLNSTMLPEDCFGNIVLDNITKTNLDMLGLDEDNIQKVVSQYDVITLIPNRISDLGQSATVYEHAKKDSPFHRIEDMNAILKIIDEKYPEFTSAAKEYMNSSKGYFCNMYILKKEIFQSYCKWLFDILETHRNSTSFYDYSVDEMRVSGFWAERLWGIYFTYLKEQNRNLKYKEVQKTFFKSTDSDLEILPAYNENNIPVVFASDNNYVPILTVALKSVCVNRSDLFNYDIIILQQNITEENKSRIKKELNSENVSIRFIDVGQVFKERNLVTPAHFTIEIYFRLVMQDVMKHYDKVIYLDSDLVVDKDIANLYSTPIGDNLVAAVQDVDSAGCYKEFDPSRKEYFDKNLCLKDPYSYFNSGVLIMNLQMFRKLYTTDYILKLAESKDYIFPDQDVLNVLCENKVYYLDESWNTMMNHDDGINSRLKVAKMAPDIIYKKYLKARKYPKIIHYAGYQKPWIYPDCDMADCFWKYARQTSFWEELVGRMAVSMAQNVIHSVPSITPAESECSDYNGIKIDGIDDSIYLDGIMIQFIKKINQKFPIGSKRRETIKKISKIFIR